MHMQLAICYLVGFGRWQDMDQVRTHLAIAADSQYPAIRPLLVWIREAFGLDHSEQLLPPLVDPMAVSIFMEAIKQTIYSSPLYEIGQVWKTAQAKEPDVGSELHRAAYLRQIENIVQFVKRGHPDHLSESGYMALILACIDCSLPIAAFY
jgi:hypothetical protein